MSYGFEMKALPSPESVYSTECGLFSIGLGSPTNSNELLLTTCVREPSPETLSPFPLYSQFRTGPSADRTRDPCLFLARGNFGENV